MFSVLGPGGVGSLAQDMAAEFGGTRKEWRKDINEPYHFKFNYAGGGKGNGKGGNGGGGNTGGGKPDDGQTKDPHNYPNPQHAMAPMTFPLGFQPAQPQQQPAVRNDMAMTPEMLALIRARFMRG